MNQKYLLSTFLLFIIFFSMFHKTGLAKIDEDLEQCIDTLLSKSPNISMIIGKKKFEFEDSVWFVLQLQAISKMEPQARIICYRQKLGNNLSWQKMNYINHTVPLEVSDFYVSYMQSREPDFDLISPPIFIGDPSAEVRKGTNVTEISADQLEGYSDFSLKLMENEILARHGAIFNDPVLNAFFSTREWYTPDKNFNESQLTVIEKKNMEEIKRYRQNLNTSDLNGIAKFAFKDSKFEKIVLGDINNDGKDEILLGKLVSSKRKIYDKAIILRNENGKYVTLLRFSSFGIFGKDGDFLCAVPGKKQVKWEITFGEDLLVSYIDINLQPVFDQIMLSWSKKSDSYYLSMAP